MGGAACKEIVNYSCRAEGTLDIFKEKNPSPELSVAMLKALVVESRTSIMYTSLYFKLEGKEGIPSIEYTKPIMEVLDDVTDKLLEMPIKDVIKFILSQENKIADALDKLEELFD